MSVKENPGTSRHRAGSKISETMASLWRTVRGPLAGPRQSVKAGAVASAMDVRQRARGHREVRGVQHLDASVLLTVEGGDDRRGGARLASQVERDAGVVEPHAQVVLVGGSFFFCCYGGHRERLGVEHAAHRGAAGAGA